MYYKLGQACVMNWGSFFITNQGKRCYKLGQLLQNSTTVIIKQGSYYKLGQNVLQIGAGITNQGNYHKLVHSMYYVPCATLKKDTKNQNFRVIYTIYIPDLYVINSDLTAAILKFWFKH